MRLLVVASMLIVINAGSHAAERVNTASQLASSPQQYVGKTVRLSRISCIDNPKGGFACVASANGRMLKIDSVALGDATPPAVADRLASNCTGTANLFSTSCDFAATFTPQSASKSMLETADGTMPATVLYVRDIDLSPAF